MEPCRLRATMEIRTRGANRLRGPYWPAELSALPRAGPTGAPWCDALDAVLWASDRRLSRLPGSVIGRERALLHPHGPHDPRELIGHGNRRDIVAATLLGLHGPALQRGRVDGRLRVPQE
jgi:hypothetical protein